MQKSTSCLWFDGGAEEAAGLVETRTAGRQGPVDIQKCIRGEME